MKFRLDNWSGEDCRCFDELAAVTSPGKGGGRHPASPGEGAAAGLFYAAGRGGNRYICLPDTRYGGNWDLLCEKLETQERFSCTEEPAYTELGVMLDCSRNGVLTTAAVARYHQISGADGVFLHTALY